MRAASATRGCRLPALSPRCYYAAATPFDRHVIFFASLLFWLTPQHILVRLRQERSLALAEGGAMARYARVMRSFTLEACHARRALCLLRRFTQPWRCPCLRCCISAATPCRHVPSFSDATRYAPYAPRSGAMRRETRAVRMYRHQSLVSACLRQQVMREKA